jgi:hypothetical protein
MSNISEIILMATKATSCMHTCVVWAESCEVVYRGKKKEDSEWDFFSLHAACGMISLVMYGTYDRYAHSTTVSYALMQQNSYVHTTIQGTTTIWVSSSANMTLNSMHQAKNNALG